MLPCARLEVCPAGDARAGAAGGEWRWRRGDADRHLGTSLVCRAGPGRTRPAMRRPRGTACTRRIGARRCRSQSPGPVDPRRAGRTSRPAAIAGPAAFACVAGLRRAAEARAPGKSHTRLSGARAGLADPLRPAVGVARHRRGRVAVPATRTIERGHAVTGHDLGRNPLPVEKDLLIHVLFPCTIAREEALLDGLAAPRLRLPRHPGVVVLVFTACGQAGAGPGCLAAGRQGEGLGAAVAVLMHLRRRPPKSSANGVPALSAAATRSTTTVRAPPAKRIPPLHVAASPWSPFRAEPHGMRLRSALCWSFVHGFSVCSVR